MADRVAELDAWIERLEGEAGLTNHEIARGARFMLRAIERTPAGSYRDMALCKLTDTVTLAAVAARQPETGSQSTAICR